MPCARYEVTPKNSLRSEYNRRTLSFVVSPFTPFRRQPDIILVTDYKSVAQVRRISNSLCCAELAKEHLNTVRFVVSLKLLADPTSGDNKGTSQPET